MSERYILIDAPGTHGTYAMIYESHQTLAEARSAAARMLGRPQRDLIVVVSDGGWNDNHQPGDRIHHSHLGAYKILWSLTLARKWERNAKTRRDLLAWRELYQDAGDRSAKLYDRDSVQYIQALGHWARLHPAPRPTE